jgi:hypothetical protein
MLQSSIRETPLSNFTRDIDYREGLFRGFTQENSRTNPSVWPGHYYLIYPVHYPLPSSYWMSGTLAASQSILQVNKRQIDSKQKYERIKRRKKRAPHVMSSFFVLTMDTQQASARRHVESYSPSDVTLPPGGELPLTPLLLNLLTSGRLNYT